MSEYKGIKGFQITTRTDDPTPYAQALTNNPYVGAWSSGGALNTGRNTLMAAGTRDANLAFAGEGPPNVTNCELYNGSSWTEVNDVNTAIRGGSGAGSSTSAIKVGGYTGSAISDSVESWNGSAWTEVAELNTDRQEQAASGGSNTSSLIFGGTTQISPSVYGAQTESWNGSAWTEVNDLNAAAKNHFGNGTATSALATSGYRPPGSTRSGATESWNGTNWTEVNDANNGRTFGGASGSDNTNALIFAGDYGGTPANVNTESWDGSSWTEVADLSTARYRNSGSPSGTSIAALATGGLNAADSVQSATEEWAFSGLDPSTTPAADYADAITGDFYYNSSTGQFKNVNDGGAPIGTWASGGNLNTTRDNQAGAGLQTSAMAISGSNPPPTPISSTENYDGTSWTEITEINTNRRYASANGPSGNPSVIFMGGYSTTNTGDTEIWNGSSWTEVNNLNIGRNNLASAGTTTANVAYGGETNPPSGGASQAYTELWDGSSWTEVSDLNEGRNSKAGAGTSGAAISVDEGGTTNVELWDGSSWTETTNYNTTRGGSVTTTSSPQSDVLLMTGVSPSGYKANCEHWNGTTWTEVADVATAMTRGGGAGSGGTSGIKFGGYTGSNTNVTEEFTAADFQIKTVTTS